MIPGFSGTQTETSSGLSHVHLIHLSLGQGKDYALTSAWGSALLGRPRDDTDQATKMLGSVAGFGCSVLTHHVSCKRIRFHKASSNMQLPSIFAVQIELTIEVSRTQRVI